MSLMLTLFLQNFWIFRFHYLYIPSSIQLFIKSIQLRTLAARFAPALAAFTTTRLAGTHFCTASGAFATSGTIRWALALQATAVGARGVASEVNQFCSHSRYLFVVMIKCSSEVALIYQLRCFRRTEIFVLPTSSAGIVPHGVWPEENLPQQGGVV